METPEADLGAFMVKIKRLCPFDFAFVAREGKCSKFLWVFLQMWGQLQDGDIQFLEGLNSKIKIHSRRSQRMTLPTLSDRMRIQPHLGHCTQSAGEKIQAGKGVINKMTMGSNSEVACELKTRWAPPTGTSLADLPTAAVLERHMLDIAPWIAVGPERTWATPYSLQFNRQYKEATVSLCLTFNTIAAGSNAYLCIDKANKDKAWCTSWMATCTVHRDPMERNRRSLLLRVKLPIELNPLGAVIAQYYTRCHEENRVYNGLVYKLDWRPWRVTRDAIVSQAPGKTIFRLARGRRRARAEGAAPGAGAGAGPGGEAEAPAPPPDAGAHPAGPADGDHGDDHGPEEDMFGEGDGDFHLEDELDELVDEDLAVLSDEERKLLAMREGIEEEPDDDGGELDEVERAGAHHEDEVLRLAEESGKLPDPEDVVAKVARDLGGPEFDHLSPAEKAAEALADLAARHCLDDEAAEVDADDAGEIEMPEAEVASTA